MQFVECFFLFSLIASVEKLFWVIFEVFLVLIYFGCAGSWLLCCKLPLVVASRGSSLAAESGLLIAVASLGVGSRA